MRRDLNLNTVTLWAMWKINGTRYTINYNLNGGKNGPAINPQVGVTQDSEVQLDNTIPSYNQSEFKGWCNKSTNNETCQGTTYQPGAMYPLGDSYGQNIEITLWAIWDLPSAQNFKCSLMEGSSTRISCPSCSNNRTPLVTKIGNNKCVVGSDASLVTGSYSSSYSSISSLCTRYGWRMPAYGEGSANFTFWTSTTCDSDGTGHFTSNRTCAYIYNYSSGGICIMEN